MCRCLKTVLFMSFLIFDCISSAPSVSFVSTKPKSDDVETKLNDFLSEYYDNIVIKMKHSETNTKKGEKTSRSVNIYDTMQGDQPVAENTISQNIQTVSTNVSYPGETNISNPEYLKAMREM